MTYQHLSRFALRFLLLVALCYLPLAAVRAQSATATLSGTVEDQNGAAVPGVEITVMNPSTALERQVTTNDQGSYTVPLLPPGKYVVTARRSGFAPAEIRDVVLNVGDQKALKIELKAGDVNATVQVTSEAPLINESPAVATTIDRTFVGNLPLNGRSFQSLILLTPGVVLTESRTSTTPGQFSVNGQRASANYFTVDGVSANVGVSSVEGGGADFSQNASGALPGLSAFGSTTTLVSIDALEEFKIQTSTYSAEFGREPGGQVQLVTRSGENQFHGTAFEYLRNEVFDANDWFSNRAGLKRAPLRQNQFGGTFSGPVVLPRFGEGGKKYWNGRDKTFFFFSYEGLRLVLPTTFNMMVPSIRLRDSATTAMKPLLNMFPVPTGPEATTDDGPSGVAPFVGNASSPSTLDATSVRIDHTLSNRLTLFGRYNDAPSSSLNRILSSLTGLKNRTRTLTIGSTFSFTPRLSNELRVNYSSNRGRQILAQDNFGGAVPVDLSLLTSGYNGPGNKYGRIQFTIGEAGLLAGLGDPIDSYQRQINVVDNISLVKDSHQLKFGIDYRRLSPVFGPAPFSEQIFLYSQSQIVNGTATFLLRANQGSRPVFDNFSAYAQDSWTLSPRLNLNLGLRWELDPAPHDANGLKPVTVVGVDNLPTATLAPPNAPFYKTFYKAFAPRLGIAYLLSRASGRETVLRGGFGVYYDLGNGEAAAGFTGFPFSAFNFIHNGNDYNVPFPLAPALVVPPPFPTAALPITDQLSALNPNLRLPYTLQWNVALEQSMGKQQVLTLSYVASAARDLLTSKTLNQAVGISSVRPNPNFATINYVTNGPTSDYQSLQAQYRVRLSHGLQALANYTWSHAIDEISNEVETDFLDRGNASFDVRHNFSAAITYDLPKLKAGILLRSLLRDWSVNAIVTAQSGSPLDIIAGTFIREDGVRVGVRPDVVAGAPFWIKDSASPGGQKINSAAFRLPPIDDSGNFLREGTLGRNVVIEPGHYQVNMAIRRQFTLAERVKMQFSAEAFNVFNHPIFGGYEEFFYPGSSSFGQATATLNRTLGGLSSLYQSGGPRSMQFSLRLSF